MADDDKKPASSSSKLADTLSSPPVVGAIISGFIAIILAIVPVVLQNTGADTEPAVTLVMPTVAATLPPPSPTVVALAATEVPPTDNPPTDVPPTTTPIPILPTATATRILPTATFTRTNTPSPVPTTAIPPTNPSPPNVLLLWDDVSFTMVNVGGAALNMENVSFRSASGTWDASQWGVGLVGNFRVNNCLRTRDVTSGERQPPPECSTLLGFQLVGGTALFWLNAAEFQVLNNNAVVAVCTTAGEACGVFIE